MRTENPGHAADHQELGPEDGENCSTGLHPLPFCTRYFQRVIFFFLNSKRELEKSERMGKRARSGGKG